MVLMLRISKLASTPEASAEALDMMKEPAEGYSAKDFGWDERSKHRDAKFRDYCRSWKTHVLKSPFSFAAPPSSDPIAEDPPILSQMPARRSRDKEPPQSARERPLGARGRGAER